jgi:hypothetical protein
MQHKIDTAAKKTRRPLTKKGNEPGALLARNYSVW